MTPTEFKSLITTALVTNQFHLKVENQPKTIPETLTWFKPFQRRVSHCKNIPLKYINFEQALFKGQKRASNMALESVKWTLVVLGVENLLFSRGKLRLRALKFNDSLILCGLAKVNKVKTCSWIFRLNWKNFNGILTFSSEKAYKTCFSPAIRALANSENNRTSLRSQSNVYCFISHSRMIFQKLS